MFQNSDSGIDWGFGAGVVISGDGEMSTTINGGVGSPRYSCPSCGGGRGVGYGYSSGINAPMLILGVAVVVLLLRK